MRISDWSSDVCSSDLILCYRSVVREKSVPTFSHEALEARAVDLLERQRIEIDARHAAQVDSADLAAIWPLARCEGLRAAGGAEAVRDRELAEERTSIGYGKSVPERVYVVVCSVTNKTQSIDYVTTHITTHK